MPAEDVVIKKILQRLKEEQEGCIELLKKPRERTSFGYGQASGILEGLGRAEQCILEVVGEEEDGTQE